MLATSFKQITILRQKAANCKRHSQCIPCLWVLLAFILFYVPMARSAQDGDFMYSSDGVSVTITNYTGSGGAITIPSLITNLPVTTIGNNAFYGYSSLSSVTIPNSVTNIGAAAFGFCSGLTSVTIPNTVTSIGGGAFFGCSGLTQFSVAASNANYSSASGVLFDKNQTLLIQCPAGKQGSYAIPNSVTNVGDGAFLFCSGLTSVTIGNSVTRIGDGAFYSCSGLTNVVIGTGVTSIGENAFISCYNLKSVTTPNSVANIGGGAFYGCSGLTSVIIGNSVTNIGNYAFNYCSGLTNVTIGNSVTNIGNYAFSDCSSLTNVTIPNSVKSIGDGAFYNSTNLTSVYFQGNAPSLGSSVFTGDTKATVYYLAGTTGWGTTFGGLTTAVWGVTPTLSVNHIGSKIVLTWSGGVLLESTNLANGGTWTTNASATSPFTNTPSPNVPGKFYRVKAN